MKRNALAPGMYKIQQSDYSSAYGAKHQRRNSNTVRLLTVKGVGDQCRYYFDEDTVGVPASTIDISNYDILSHFESGRPTVRECSISISFTDSSGEWFCFTSKNFWELKRILEFHTWLKEPSGYVKKK
jgi:hypothetical protein